MFKKILTLLIISTLFLSGCTNNVGTQEDVMIGSSYPDASWVIIGDNEEFSGYQTKFDATKSPIGSNPNGQNTTANEGDRISVRNLGYEVFPDGESTTTATAINSLHTFRKRSGENIMIRTYGTVMEYFDESGNIWETLRTGLTDGKSFGFADYNINTDLVSYTYFGNAYDNAARWTGAHTNLNGALSIGASTLTVDDASGFKFSTSTLIVCGTSLVYSSLNLGTNTFTLSASSTIACADGRGVAEAVQEFSAHPKGNIYLEANNRLFIAGISSTSQAVYFSEYGDATNFVGADLVTDSTDTSPGIFNLGVGGGAVTGMVLDENSIYIFKRSTIWRATLTDTIYTLTDLKPFDGKGQTIGAVSNKSIFTGGNGVYFITPDNQIMSLQRVETVDFPQVVPLSDVIQPTVDGFNFEDSCGIVFRNKAYFGVKSNTTVSHNNTVLVWNIKDKMWDSPIVGWDVDDFLVYDDGTSEELYFGSDVTLNTYKVNQTPVDDIYDVKANWRSKQFTFDAPHQQKQMTDMFVEGYIAPNTTLTINLLLDEDGYTQMFSTDINGTDDSTYVYDSSEFNVIGLSPFGSKRFGSNDDLSGKKKFRVYLGKDFRALPFYNAQIEFASDGDNQQWEVLVFGMEARIYSVPEKRELYKAFK